MFLPPCPILLIAYIQLTVLCAQNMSQCACCRQPAVCIPICCYGGYVLCKPCIKRGAVVSGTVCYVCERNMGKRAYWLLEEVEDGTWGQAKDGLEGGYGGYSRGQSMGGYNGGPFGVSRQQPRPYQLLNPRQQCQPYSPFPLGPRPEYPAQNPYQSPSAPFQSPSAPFQSAQDKYYQQFLSMTFREQAPTASQPVPETQKNQRISMRFATGQYMRDSREDRMREGAEERVQRSSSVKNLSLRR